MDAHVEINLEVKIFKENDYYIAFSPDLQLSTQGKTIKQVKKRFEDRIAIFIERALETKTLEKRLKKLGWGNIRHEPTPPKDVMVPRELLMAKQCESMDYQLIY